MLGVPDHCPFIKSYEHFRGKKYFNYREDWVLSLLMGRQSVQAFMIWNKPILEDLFYFRV